MSHIKGSYVLDKNTNEIITIEEGNKISQYKCPKCDEDVIYKKGEIITTPYFSHKQKTSCANYSNESEIHLNAKCLLKKVLEKRNINIEISRKCTCCKQQFLWTLPILPPNIIIREEYSFFHINSNRIADIACIDDNSNIEIIFEICNTNQTKSEYRPEPWFEFDALSICDQLTQSQLSNTIILNCIRDTYCKENAIYGLCNNCETDSLLKGKIFFNQRGAGCGKTYESIQLLNRPDFSNKRSFIYLTKMRSARDVILEEFESQYRKGLLSNFIIIEKQSLGNQHLIILQKPDNTIIRIIIGTIDSFTFAIRNRNTVFNGGRDLFQKLVKDIRDGNMDIARDGGISYAHTRVRLTDECLTIIDEGQDLEKEYIEAFEAVINRTGIDTYIIGDKLQSILSEKNLFTHLEDPKESSRIIKSTGKNIIKRCHNKQFIDIINRIVDFESHNLPQVEGICLNSNCGYIHEDNIKPYTVDTGFQNIFTISPEDINSCIERIKKDILYKIKKHGYLPNNFMFIFQ